MVVMEILYWFADFCNGKINRLLIESLAFSLYLHND